MNSPTKLAVPLWSRALHTKSHTMHISQELNGLRIQINSDKEGTCTSFYMKGAGARELTEFLNEVVVIDEVEFKRQEDSRNANHVDGYDRDDLGLSPDY